MSKKNKIRYKSQGNQFPIIILTGKVSMREVELEPDDETDEEVEIAEPIPPEKGDMQIYLSTDSVVYNIHVGDFYSIGLDGFLKASVFDGKGWKPLSLEEFFPDRDNYFGKRERPIDTYNLCLSVLENAKGIPIVRTYREHYRIKTPGDDEITMR